MLYYVRYETRHAGPLSTSRDSWDRGPDAPILLCPICLHAALLPLGTVVEAELVRVESRSRPCTTYESTEYGLYGVLVCFSRWTVQYRFFFNLQAALPTHTCMSGKACSPAQPAAGTNLFLSNLNLGQTRYGVLTSYHFYGSC